MAKDKDIIEEAREYFALAQESESENRVRYVEDMRFARLGEQWPDQVRQAREREGRPILTINRMPSFARQVVNDSRQNRPSIKVHPADSTADPKTAEVISGLIRNIEVTSNADVAYDTAVENAVYGGWGYIRIATDYAHDDSFDLDICIKRVVNPLTIYGDPASETADSSDWNCAFVTELLDEDEFERKYKGADAVSFDAESHDDEKSGEDVRVAEYWKREEVPTKLLKLSNGLVLPEKRFIENAEIFAAAGIQVVGDRDSKTHKVVQRILSGSEVLEEVDWPGRFIPIIPVYGEEVHIEGKRHWKSLIHDAKDAQRMMNYWRTSSTELVALQPKAPWIGPKGFANADPSKWATANTKTHAYLEYAGPVAPNRVGFSGPDAGALQEALNASDDMKAITGIYDASLGARSNETSGRAIMARQREGDVGTFHFQDNLARAIRHCGRILIDLIPAVYSGPRVVRVMGEDSKPRNVQVNQEQPQPDGSMLMLDLTAGKYDLTVSAGPGFTSRREEAANQMTEFIRVFPAAAPVLGDLLAKNLDWPQADEVAKRLQAMLPPQIQGADPRLQQAQQQMQQMGQVINQLKQQLQQVQADKAIESNKISIDARKVDVDAFKAETDRMQVVAPAMSPEQIQTLVMQTLQQVLSSPDVLPPQQPAPTPQAPMPN